MPKNREATNEYNRNWSKNNKDKRNESIKRYIQKNPEFRLLNTARNNARRSGREFSITKDDIFIPEKCPYLDIPLHLGVGVRGQQNTMSIDRIDSSKGYIPGNVQIISSLANQMKQNATKEQLITFAKNILRMYDEAC